jgi:hypothetical protein
MGTRDRIPSDPDKRHEYLKADADLKETEADRKRAQVRAAEEKKRREHEAEEGKKAVEQRQAEIAAEIAKRKEEAAAAREKLLQTPLSDEDRKKLEKYEAKASAQGNSNPSPEMMKELADLRIRAKLDKKK